MGNTGPWKRRMCMALVYWSCEAEEVGEDMHCLRLLWRAWQCVLGVQALYSKICSYNYR